MSPFEQTRIARATAGAADEILALQKIAYLSEAKILDDYTIAPLHQSLEDLLAELDQQVFLTATDDNAVVGSVRCRLDKGTCFIGRLIVRPSHQNRGIGRRLLKAAEERFPQAERYELFTSRKSKKNLYLYRCCGYRPFKKQVLTDKLTLVYLEKLAGPQPGASGR